jgi:hypothetical protein
MLSVVGEDANHGQQEYSFPQKKNNCTNLLGSSNRSRPASMHQVFQFGKIALSDEGNF